MALKFTCNKCRKEIVVRFLKKGDICECRFCGNKITIPEDSIETQDDPTFEHVRRPKITISENLTPEEEKTLEPFADVVTDGLFAGKNKTELAKVLVKENWTQESATRFVDKIEQSLNEGDNNPIKRQLLIRKYKRHMLFGFLWAIGGTIVTVVSYLIAASSLWGGSYLIAWGAIVFGLIEFAIGLVGWFKNRNKSKVS